MHYEKVTNILINNAPTRATKILHSVHCKNITITLLKYLHFGTNNHLLHLTTLESR